MINRFKKLMLCLILAIAGKTDSFSQTYGNEWLDWTQFHGKIKIWKDNVYRLGYFSIEPWFTSRGLFLNNISINDFAIYNMGQQVPVYIYDQNSNNRLDAFDYIEFVGHPATGEIDQGLYEKPEHQRHQLKNMMSDTNVYFFTVRPGRKNLRYTSFTGSAAIPSRNYHISRFVYAPDQNYSEGEYMALGNHAVFYSDYMPGEGFVGDYFWAPSQYSVILKHPDLNPLGPMPELETGLTAHTPPPPGSTVPNNRFATQISADGNVKTLLSDTTFLGIRPVTQRFKLKTADMGQDQSLLLFNPQLAGGSGSGMYGHSHTVLHYPRNNDFKDSSRYFFYEDTAYAPHTEEWSNYGKSPQNNPVFYDEVNGLRYTGVLDPGTRKLSVVVPPMAQRGRISLIDESRVEMLPFFRVDTVSQINYNYHIGNCEFLMVSSRTLVSPKGELNDYKALRENRYSVQLNLVQNLYDYFSYGLPHPLAIRNYCKFLIEKSSPSSQPKFLLLIGRGFDNGYNRGSGLSQLLPLRKFNHVPTIGHPVSDWMFTSGLGNAKPMEPAIATGRIPADSARDISIYLDKLKGYIRPENNYQEWQKQILHLSGGSNANESNIIKNIVDGLRVYPEGDPFAGVVTQFSKSSIGIVDPNFKDKIVSRINSGTSLISFLGHGSLSVTDIDIGVPEKYLNEGKYPICYFNGCQVGNPALPTTQKGLGERVFRGEKKGAIAFMGQVSLSELYTISSQMRYFYEVYFDSTPNKTLGGVLKTMLARWQNPGSSLNKIHSRQLFLQGDPAIAVYTPQLPDFSINSQSIFLKPEGAFALMDSFDVGVVVRNYGRGVSDSFSVNLQWIYPDGVTKRNYSTRSKQRGFEDTIFLRVASKDVQIKGENFFNITVNKEKNPDEYTYLNNAATLKRYIPGNGVNLISPKNFAIWGRDTVDLVAQAGNVFKQNEDYYFELDTTPRFNSPLLISLEKQGKPLNRAILASWTTKLPLLKDTLPYYWRARISASVNEGGGWQTGSFTYIKSHTNGWMQNVHWQYTDPVSRNELVDMRVDSASKSLKFKKVLKKIYIDCQYMFHPNKGVKEGGFGGQDMNWGVCKEGLVAIPWNGKKLLREAVDPAKIWPDCWPGALWSAFGHSSDEQLYYAFQMNIESEQDKFIDFINALPDSNYVTIFSRRQNFANTWKPEVLQALNLIGSNIFDSSQYRTADAMWVCLGKKGTQPGTAQEKHTFGSVAAYVGVEGEMIGDANNGYMKSERIGPVDQFGTLYTRPILTQIPKVERDEFDVSVFGIDTAGTEDLLQAASAVTQHNLSAVNTQRYKYIYLKGRFADVDGNTSPNLLHWRVTHAPVPEGTIFPSPLAGYKFYNDTLYEGDTFQVVLPFKNISKVNFRDSIELEYKIYNKITRVEIKAGKMKFAALRPDSLLVFREALATLGLSGPYALQLAFNPGFRQPELSMANNAAILNFYVQKDIINPLLDVTFDGKHIMNGEIVSPSPFILVSSKDENKHLLQSDSQKMVLFIKKPGSGSFEQVSGSELIYTPASNRQNRARMEYRPVDLADGIYILKVQSWDFSGNQAGRNDYEISFNVVREQTVTRFYPYPNPFTSKMRFVFTLTGTRIPEEIRVKIMNVEGRVVKEVSKEELGNLRIGNNITDWTWDGTDQFGDRLANGTYFYKVTVKDGGEELKLRATKGDASFKEQVGVIYLMR
jgi:hypothetical protein